MKKSKLNIQKFKIAVLKNQSIITGGNGDDGETLGNTNTGKIVVIGGIEYECINKSKRYLRL
jgi:hypothetical protein